MPPPCRGSVKCVDWATPWVRPSDEAYHTPVALREVLCASGKGLRPTQETSHMALIYEE